MVQTNIYDQLVKIYCKEKIVRPFFLPPDDNKPALYHRPMD